MPRDQQELELTVGRKFGGALKHFRNMELVNLASGAGRGDLIADIEGVTTKIQVTELVDQRVRILRDRRKTYSHALVDDHADRLAGFGGCSVELTDSTDPPYLPSIRSRDGVRAVEELAMRLAGIAEDVPTLKVGHRRVRKAKVGPNERDVIVTIVRRFDVEDDKRWALHWGGAGPGYEEGSTRGLVEVVNKKLTKRYDKPDEPFWLLVYSTDTLIMPGDPAFHLTEQLLGHEQHPFDQVWYFYPYDNWEMGHVIQIWPSSPEVAA